MGPRISEARDIKVVMTPHSACNQKASKLNEYFGPESNRVGKIQQRSRQQDKESSRDAFVDDLIALPSAERRDLAMHMQRQFGNRRVQKLIVQAKLKVGTPGDEFEQEADLVANMISRVLDPGSILKMAKPNLGERQPSHGLEISPELEGRINSLRGGGRTLDAKTRAFFEPAFGYGFSGVRVHVGSQADEVTRSLKARALTIGQDIIFESVQFNPGSLEGRRLLAHELTHIMQKPGNLLMKKSQNPVVSSSKSTDWDSLPKDIRDVLEYSFITRRSDESIWKGQQTASGCFNDKNIWTKEQMLAFKNVYNALSQQGLWLWVERVSHVYPTNVNGIKFKPDNRGDLAERLSNTPRFCCEMDWHYAWQKRKNPPEWRQVANAGSPGLHIIIPKSGLCDAHIDTIAPIKGREPNGDCILSSRHGPGHLLKDYWGL